MYRRVERTFYGLSAIALMAFLFIVTPSNSQEVTAFQTSVVAQTKTAVHEIFGQMNPVADLAFIWNGNRSFYAQSSTELLAVIPAIDEVPAPVQSEIDHVAYGATLMITRGIDSVLGINHAAARPDVAAGEARGEVLGVQTQEPPQTISESATIPLVPAEPELPAKQIDSVRSWVGEAPANTQMHPWVTLQDNVTGEPYCVAIFDNQIEKYPGACRYDYH